MAISAALVKTLRERTGAGMMECKRALQATDGDIDAAIEKMRKEGLAKADKKAGRTAAEGMIAMAEAKDGSAVAMVEINSETDFVAKSEEFQQFAGRVAQSVLADGAEPDHQSLQAKSLDGETVDEARRALVAKVGENVDVRRAARIGADGAHLAAYSHGGRIGVLVAVEGGDDTLARDLALHIAASAPQYVTPDDVPESVRAREREIFIAQAKDSGKPAEIVDKMVEGRLRKFLNEIALEGQPFVKDPDATVGKLLKQKGARVRRFERFEVGEGIHKEEGNFAEEVMAQVQGTN